MTFAQEIRIEQRRKIEHFLSCCGGHFSGRYVLDYGCGKAPYREIVERNGGNWAGWDHVEYPGNVSGRNIGASVNPLQVGPRVDVVLSTQMLQYVPDPHRLLLEMRGKSDKLIMTYATNWPEIEPWDLHRFTRGGMEHLLRTAGWNATVHEPLGEFRQEDFVMVLGYGVIAL